jgi:hypothetical protein
MHEQLVHLEELSLRSRVVAQVVPFKAVAHAGLLGAFVLASFDSSADTVYLETAGSGQITELPSVVSEITLVYETLRFEALPRGASRTLIAKVAEERWT